MVCAELAVHASAQAGAITHLLHGTQGVLTEHDHIKLLNWDMPQSLWTKSFQKLVTGPNLYRKSFPKQCLHHFCSTV